MIMCSNARNNLFFCTRLLFVFNDEGAAAKEPTELFIKNTGLC